MFKDQYRAVMQYSLPRDGRPGEPPRVLHDWICSNVSYTDYLIQTHICSTMRVWIRLPMSGVHIQIMWLLLLILRNLSRKDFQIINRKQIEMDVKTT